MKESYLGEYYKWNFEQITKDLNFERNIMNKYQRTIKTIEHCGEKIDIVVDVYDVLNVYKTDNPAIDHAVKKLLCPGKRGHKDRMTDLNEALKSLKRAIDLEQL